MGSLQDAHLVGAPEHIEVLLAIQFGEYGHESGLFIIEMCELTFLDTFDLRGKNQQGVGARAGLLTESAVEEFEQVVHLTYFVLVLCDPFRGENGVSRSGVKRREKNEVLEFGVQRDGTEQQVTEVTCFLEKLIVPVLAEVG